MADIIIITHIHDDFLNRRYQLRALANLWVRAGHNVSVAAGIGDWPQADIAVLHVDLSVVPAIYLEACKRYRVVINGAATDIRKSRMSRQLLTPDDGWDGPVIIKTDLNCGGMPEMRTFELARLNGTDSGLPDGNIVCTRNPYPILDSASEVPDTAWNNPGLVVEKFLPELDPRGYWLRIWVFFGDRERCTRCLGSDPVLKGAGILAREPCSVPESIRAERERLGFDYGKFDFVMHAGEAVLLDANRTPNSAAPAQNAAMAQSDADLAQGIERILTS